MIEAHGHDFQLAGSSRIDTEQTACTAQAAEARAAETATDGLIAGVSAVSPIGIVRSNACQAITADLRLDWHSSKSLWQANRQRPIRFVRDQNRPGSSIPRNESGVDFACFDRVKEI
jgi:hypothetical protein